MNTLVGKRSGGLFVLMELLLAYRMLCTFVPYVMAVSPTIVNIPVLLLLYACFFSLLPADRVIAVVQKFFPFAMLYIMNYILRASSFSMVDVIMTLLRFFVWPIGMAIIYRYEKVNIARVLLFVFVMAITGSMITTYFGNLAFPGVSRAMTHYHSDGLVGLFKFYQRMNIGGFDFIYLLPFLPPFVFFFFKKVSNRWIRLMCLGFLYVIAITVYQAEFTTALVLTAMSLTLLLLPKKVGVRKLFVYYVVVGLAFYLGASTVSTLFSAASDETEFSTYSERMENISDLIQGNDVGEGNTANRIALYQRSFNSFIESPLGGGKAGGHSMVLDLLGSYGIFSLIFLIWGFQNLYKNCVWRYMGHPIYEYTIYIFVLQLIVGFLNPVLNIEVFLLLIPLFAMSYGIEQFKFIKS